MTSETREQIARKELVKFIDVIANPQVDQAWAIERILAILPQTPAAGSGHDWTQTILMIDNYLRDTDPLTADHRHGLVAARDGLRAVRKALTACPPPVDSSLRDGWVLTSDMQGAAELAFLKHRNHASHLAVPAIFRAMIAASPPLDVDVERMARAYAKRLHNTDNWADFGEAYKDAIIQAMRAALSGAPSEGGGDETGQKFIDNEIELLCREHDREDAAQRGEPSPWDLPMDEEDMDALTEYLDFRENRIAAMRAAVDPAPSPRSGEDESAPSEVKG